MKPYKNYTLSEYLNCLAEKSPTPGGGSAAALTAALGVALLSMVAEYSKGKSGKRDVEAKISKIIIEANKSRKRLLELVDLDAKAYLDVIKTRKASAATKKKALITAREVPLEVCRLTYKAIEVAPYLVECGNKYLVADVAVACELLLSAFNGALTLAQYN